MSAKNLVNGEKRTLSPVQKLPPELLIHIFSVLTTLDTPDVLKSFVADASGPYSLKTTSFLRPLLGVCRAWRQITLDTSSLWSSVSCVRDSYNQEDHAPIHVSRLPPGCPGEHTPLAVYAEVPTLEDTIYKDFLKAHRDQIEELIVRVYDAGYNGGTMAGDVLLSTVSPRALKRLVLLGSGILPMTSYPFTERRLFNPFELELTSLALHNLPLLPTLNVERCNHLTRFVLAHGYFGAPEGLPPVDKVLRMLMCMPVLREAYIEELRFADSTKPADLPAAVSLPKLRKLRLSSGPAAASLLVRLELPQNCLVRLETDLLGEGEIQSVVNVVKRMRWTQTKVHCVWDGRGWGRGGLQHVSLQAIGLVSSQNTGDEQQGGLRIDMYNRNMGTDDDFVQAMRAILSQPPFVRAEEVWLSGSKTSVLLDAVEPALSEARAIHLLSLNAFDKRDAGALWPRRTAWGGWEAEFGSLPHLRSLHVCLRDKHGLASLRDLLSARTATGHPVVRLVVSYRLPRDGMRAASDTQEIRTAAEEFVEEVEIGTDLYDRYAWWKTVPRECTAVEETHLYWPAWVEGAGHDLLGRFHLDLSREEMAFGISF